MSEPTQATLDRSMRPSEVIFNLGIALSVVVAAAGIFVAASVDPGPTNWTIVAVSVGAAAIVVTVGIAGWAVARTLERLPVHLDA